MSDAKYTTMVITHSDSTDVSVIRHLWTTPYVPSDKEIAEYLKRPKVCALLKPRNTIENSTDRR